MKIYLTVTKIVWWSAENVRSILRPLIAGTSLYKFLQRPSKFIRRRLNWRELAKDSIFCREDEMAMCSLLPSAVLDLMLKRFNPKTVLDVGCGTGRAIDYLLKCGVDAVGIEGSALAISKALNSQRIFQRNLNEAVFLGRRFDVVFSYEVLEHIHPDFLNAMISTLTAHSDILVLSHAQPGQGGEGHFNEQTDEYWIDQFLRVRYKIDWPATREFKACKDGHANNLLVFRRSMDIES